MHLVLTRTAQWSGCETMPCRGEPRRADGSSGRGVHQGLPHVRAAMRLGVCWVDRSPAQLNSAISEGAEHGVWGAVYVSFYPLMVITASLRRGSSIQITTSVARGAGRGKQQSACKVCQEFEARAPHQGGSKCRHSTQVGTIDHSALDQGHRQPGPAGLRTAESGSSCYLSMPKHGESAPWGESLLSPCSASTGSNLVL